MSADGKFLSKLDFCTHGATLTKEPGLKGEEELMKRVEFDYEDEMWLEKAPLLAVVCLLVQYVLIKVRNKTRFTDPDPNEFRILIFNSSFLR